MIGGSNGDGDRSALSDITNQNRKRGYLSMSSSLIGKDGNGCEEDNLKRAERVLLMAKQLCVSQKLGSVEESEENVATSNIKVTSEIKVSSPVNLMNEKLHCAGNEMVVPAIAKQDTFSKNSYISGIPKLLDNGLCRYPKSSSAVNDENCKDGKDVLDIDVPGNIAEVHPSSEALTTRAIGNNSKGVDVDDTTSNKSLPLESVTLSLSSSSKDLELQKCIGFNDDVAEKSEAYKETLNLNKSTSAECIKRSTSSSSKVLESGRCVGYNSDDGGKCKNDDEMGNFDISKNILGNGPLDEELITHVIGSDGEDMDSDDLTSNKSSSVGYPGISGSSSTKGFEVERCMAFNGDGSSASSTGSDLLKACSCSFCLKAAHIWSDLHYQDTKGRLAVLKKSRKEVRTLVEKSCTLGDSAKSLKRSLNNSIKLESDLVGGWRSLFLHTEDILIRESAHLQSNLISLKELRARCKTNLEMISGDLPNKQ